MVYCKDSTPRWVLSVLQRYPTAAKLAKARKSSLSLIPYVNAQKAQDLINAAKQSVASSTDETTEQIINAIVLQVKQLNQTIETQVKSMAEKCSLPEVELLKSFIGIGNDSKAEMDLGASI